MQPPKHMERIERYLKALGTRNGPPELAAHTEQLCWEGFCTDLSWRRGCPGS